MIGKNFIKRGLVVALVAMAAIGMLAVTGGAAGDAARLSGGAGVAATSVGQGQNGQCDRAGFANSTTGASVFAFSETTVLTIANYKHPCAGPLIFNSFSQLAGGFAYAVEVRAVCVSGCGGTTYGHPSAGGWFIITYGTAGAYNYFPYSGSFPNLAVGIYNIELRLLTGGGTGTVAARSLQVQSYAGPTTGGGGIGG